MKNKRNLNKKWLLLQNDQNADTTLLHSHDDLPFSTKNCEFSITILKHLSGGISAFSKVKKL